MLKKTIYVVKIMKEKCIKCESEFDETEYMQIVSSFEINGERNKIEDITPQKICGECFSKFEFQNYIDSVSVKAV